MWTMWYGIKGNLLIRSYAYRVAIYVSELLGQSRSVKRWGWSRRLSLVGADYFGLAVSMQYESDIDW